MNINREFSANANRPSPREVELFFDIEENSLAYIDHNRIKRLVPGEGRNAPSSTILCRLDLSTTKGVDPSILIVENPLTQDFKFRIRSEISGEFIIENGAGSVFADPNKARIIVDPVSIVDGLGNITIFEPQINLNTPSKGKSTNLLTLKFKNGKTVPEGNFTTWLEITVFNIQGRKLQRTYTPPVKPKI